MTLAGEEQAEQILSQDSQGRVLVTRERRESLLEEYDRSGMSGVRFAQYVGIKYTIWHTGLKAASTATEGKVVDESQRGH
jgi:hypothetical protein